MVFYMMKDISGVDIGQRIFSVPLGRANIDPEFIPGTKGNTNYNLKYLFDLMAMNRHE